MMKKLTLILLIVMTVMVLSACRSESEPSTQADSESRTITEVRINEQEQEPETEEVSLSMGFDDALSIDGQLAIGTVQLEDTDLAVDADQAANLIPLWQAYQSLSSSDTTAEIELNAVLNQIHDTMRVDQITAIADMQLTNDALTQMMEEGDLAFGRGGFGGLRGSGEERQEGGFTGGFQGRIPGQGPGGGGLPGGGPGGGGFGELSEDDIATRQAQFTEGGFGDIQGRLFTGVVIRLLQEKTGETPETGGVFTAIYDVIAEETGLSIEEIQEQTVSGITLAEIIESNGGDVELIQEKLLAALDATEQFRGQDLEEFLANILH